MRSIAPALALLLAAIGTAGAAAAPELAGSSRGGNTAVLALLEAAEQELNADRPDQASLLLERALRIEPSNAAVWHYLGIARLGQGKYAQAEAMAAKSKNLAARDRALRSRNARLTAAALQASGRAVVPASDESPVLAALDSFDAAIERASTYVDAWQQRERSDRAEQRVYRRLPENVVRSPDRRRADDPYAEQVRRQRAARQGRVESQAAPEHDARPQRRSDANAKGRVQIQI